MSRHNDELYIHHIQEASRKIIQRLQGITRAAFDANEEKQDSIIRQMEIIGEAAGQVSEAFRHSHPGIDWQGMKDLRNVLIHGYADVNLDRVWRIAPIRMSQNSTTNSRRYSTNQKKNEKKNENDQSRGTTAARTGGTIGSEQCALGGDRSGRTSRSIQPTLY